MCPQSFLYYNNFSTKIIICVLIAKCHLMLNEPMQKKKVNSTTSICKQLLHILTFSMGTSVINLSGRLSPCTKRGNNCVSSTIHNRHILLKLRVIVIFIFQFLFYLCYAYRFPNMDLVSFNSLQINYNAKFRTLLRTTANFHCITIHFFNLTFI
jgi:hypothetical protein